MPRLSYRVFRFASGLNYSLPRRLTKAGLLVLAGVVLTGAVGSDLEQSVASQAFALLVCLLGVAFARALTFRGQFAVERALPQLASVGQSFRYRVEVRNSSTRTFHGLELLEDLAEPHPTFEEFTNRRRPIRLMKAFRLAPRPGPGLDMRPALVKPAALPPLRAKSVTDSEVEVTPWRRGALRFSGATLARHDPFGLVRGFVRVSMPQTVWVLPRRYRIPARAVPGTRHYQPGGVALASSIGESEEFVALRDYRPGDPLRRIHWRSWARVGQPIVKEYQDEFFVRQGLVLDTSVPVGGADSFEEAISVAASFACTVDTQEMLLDFLFAGSDAFCFTAGRALGQSEKMLELLAGLQPAPESRFAALSALVLRHAPLLSACVCVFLRWDDARSDLVRRLKAQGLPVVTFVVADNGPQALSEAGSAAAGVHLLRTGSVEQDLRRLEE